MRVKSTPILALFGGWSREGVLLHLQELGYTIETVLVPAKPSEKLARSIGALEEAGLAVVPCARADLATVLPRFAGRTLLSVGFPYLIPGALLADFPIRLNVHPTRLPRYRGPTTAAHILLNNESASGSTVHVLTEGTDDGPIIAQSHVPLTRFDTLRSLQRKVYASEPALVAEALARLEAGEAPRPQDESAATSYPRKRRPEDSQIDPARPLVELIDAIRACDPEDFPAFFHLEGQKVCVRLWRPERPADDGADML